MVFYFPFLSFPSFSFSFGLCFHSYLLLLNITGDDLPKEYLENIYDRTLTSKIGGANDNNYKGDPLEDIKNLLVRREKSGWLTRQGGKRKK